MIKNLPANTGDLGSIPGLEYPLEEMQPTPVFLPGESHGWRSLAGTVHGAAHTLWYIPCVLYQDATLYPACPPAKPCPSQSHGEVQVANLGDQASNSCSLSLDLRGV